MASVPFGKLACAIRLVSSGMGASGWACSDIFDPPSGLHASSYSFPSTLPASASRVQLSIPIFPAESFIHPVREYLPLDPEDQGFVLPVESMEPHTRR